MVKNKGHFYLDPVKDKTLLHIFTDLKTAQIVQFELNGKKEKQKWASVSRKIGIKCKDLINAKPPLLHPTSIARWHNIGFITRPEDIDIEIKPALSKQKKIVLTRKIF